MSVENIEKQFRDYLALPNYIKFFRSAVELFFPPDVDIDRVKKEEIVAKLDKLILFEDQLRNLKLFVDKFEDSVVREMHFYPTESQFSRKIVLFLSAAQDFLKDKGINIQSNHRVEFDKTFYSNTFVYVAEVLREDIEKFITDNKIVMAGVSDKVARVRNQAYEEGRFFYLNIYNIFYILLPNNMLWMVPLGAKNSSLHQEVLKIFLSQKLQDVFVDVVNKYSLKIDTSFLIEKEQEKQDNDNVQKRERKFSILKEKAEDERNQWYLHLGRYVKNGSSAFMNLKYFFFDKSFFNVLEQYCSPDQTFLNILSGKDVVDNDSMKPEAKTRERSSSTVGLISGFKAVSKAAAEVIDTKNRKKTRTFIDWLINYYASSFGGINISDEKFAEFLLIMAGLLAALRNTPVKKGQGSGNELARYLVTGIWSAFEISKEEKISENNDDKKLTLTNNLFYLEQLLCLQAFILSPQTLIDPIVGALTGFVQEPIKKEPKVDSHEKKIKFAFKFLAKLREAETEAEFVNIFGLINEGIKLSRDMGKRKASTGLENHLVELRDGLILAIVEKRLKPGKGFTLSALTKIYHKITGSELAKQDEEIVEISAQAIPLLQFMVEEFPNVLDKSFTDLYTCFLNMLNKAPESKNGQKFDKDGYIKARLTQARDFIDGQFKIYEKKYNNSDRTPIPIKEFGTALWYRIAEFNKKAADKIEATLLVNRPRLETVMTKSSSSSSEEEIQDFNLLAEDLKRRAAERDSKRQLEPEVQLVSGTLPLAPSSQPQSRNCNNNSVDSSTETSDTQTETRARARSRAFSTQGTAPRFPFDAQTPPAPDKGATNSPTN